MGSICSHPNEKQAEADVVYNEPMSAYMPTVVKPVQSGEMRRKRMSDRKLSDEPNVKEDPEKTPEEVVDDPEIPTRRNKKKMDDPEIKGEKEKKEKKESVKQKGKELQKRQKEKELQKRQKEKELQKRQKGKELQKRQKEKELQQKQQKEKELQQKQQKEKELLEQKRQKELEEERRLEKARQILEEKKRKEAHARLQKHKELALEKQKILEAQQRAQEEQEKKEAQRKAREQEMRNEAIRQQQLAQQKRLANQSESEIQKNVVRLLPKLPNLSKQKNRLVLPTAISSNEMKTIIEHENRCYEEREIRRRGTDQSQRYTFNLGNPIFTSLNWLGEIAEAYVENTEMDCKRAGLQGGVDSLECWVRCIREIQSKKPHWFTTFNNDFSKLNKALSILEDGYQWEKKLGMCREPGGIAKFLHTYWFKRLKSLKDGEIICTSSQWSTVGSGHAIFYTFQKIKDNNWQLTISNSGDGLDFHCFSTRLFPLKAAKCDLTIPDIPDERWFDEAWWLIFFKIVVHQSANHRKEHVYEILLPWMAGCTLAECHYKTRDDPKAEFTPPQIAGTCYYRCVTKGTRYILRTQGCTEIQSKQINFLVRAQFLFFAEKDVHVASEISESAERLIRMGIKEVAWDAKQELVAKRMNEKMVVELHHCIQKINERLETIKISSFTQRIQPSLQVADEVSYFEWDNFGQLFAKRLFVDLNLKKNAADVKSVPLSTFEMKPKNLQDLLDRLAALCDYLDSIGKHALSPQNHKQVFLEQAFQMMVPVPKPSSASDYSQCIYRQKMTRNQQIFLLQTINHLAFTHRCSRFIVPRTRNSDAVAIVFAAHCLTIVDATVRNIAQNSMGTVSKVISDARLFCDCPSGVKLESYLETCTILYPRALTIQNQVLEYLKDLEKTKKICLFQGRREWKYKCQEFVRAVRIYKEEGAEFPLVSGYDGLEKELRSRAMETHKFHGFTHPKTLNFNHVSFFFDFIAWRTVSFNLQASFLQQMKIENQPCSNVNPYNMAFQPHIYSCQELSSPEKAVCHMGFHSQNTWEPFRRNLVLMSASNPKIHIKNTKLVTITENDILHEQQLPHFDNAISSEECELLLTYFTTPYMRVPLVLNFFCNPGRIMMLLTPELRLMLEGAIFDRGAWVSLSASPSSHEVPLQQNEMGTSHGLLWNEIMNNAGAVIAPLLKILAFAREKFETCDGNSGSAHVILFVVRLLCRTQTFVMKSIQASNSEGLKALYKQVEDVLKDEIIPLLEKWISNEKDRSSICRLYAHLAMVCQGSIFCPDNARRLITSFCYLGTWYGFVGTNDKKVLRLRPRFQKPSPKGAAAQSQPHVVRQSLEMFNKDTDYGLLMDDHEMISIQYSVQPMIQHYLNRLGSKDRNNLLSLAIQGITESDQFVPYDFQPKEKSPTNVVFTNNIYTLDVSHMALLFRSNLIKPASADITSQYDYLATIGSKVRHLSQVSVSEHLSIYAVVGTNPEYRVLHFQERSVPYPETLGAMYAKLFYNDPNYFSREYSAASSPLHERWIRNLLLDFLIDFEIDAYKLRIPKVVDPNAMTIELIYDCPIPDEQKTGRLTDSWKVLKLYRLQQRIDVFLLSEFGREIRKVLVYSSNTRECLDSLSEDNGGRRKPWAPHLRHSGGYLQLSHSHNPSIVLQKVYDNGSIEEYIPYDSLSNLLPSCLTESFLFWADPQRGRFIGHPRFKEGCDEDESCIFPYRLEIHRNSNDTVIVKRVEEGHDDLYLVNISNSFRSACPMYNLKKILTRIENLSHTLVWTKDNPLQKNGISIHSIEMPRLGISFGQKIDPITNESHLYSLSHSGLFVAKNTPKPVQRLFDVFPHGLLMQNATEEYFILCPSYCLSCPSILSQPLHSELVQIRDDVNWMRATKQRVFVYPIHSSFQFLIAPSLNAKLYYGLLLALYRRHQEACSVLQTCDCDVAISEEEAFTVSQFIALAGFGMPDDGAVQAKLSLALRDQKISVPASTKLYFEKIHYVSGDCRLNVQELKQLTSDQHILATIRAFETNKPVSLNGVDQLPKETNFWNTMPNDTNSGWECSFRYKDGPQQEPVRVLEDAEVEKAMSEIWEDDLSGTKHGRGFIFLYQVLTRKLILKIGGKDIGVGLARIATQNLFYSTFEYGSFTPYVNVFDRNKSLFPFTVLKALAQASTADCESMPSVPWFDRNLVAKWDQQGGYGYGVIKGNNSMRRVLQDFLNAMAKGTIKILGKIKSRKMGNVLTKAETFVWKTPSDCYFVDTHQCTDHNCGSRTFSKTSKYLDHSLDAHAGQPLSHLLNINEYVTNVSPESVSSDEVPFDVSEYVTGYTSKKLMERLEQNMKQYSEKTNNAKISYFRFLTDQEIPNQKNRDYAMRLCYRLNQTLEESLRQDRRSVDITISKIMQEVNDISLAKETTELILHRLSGRRYQLFFEDVAVLLSSTQAEKDFQRCNPKIQNANEILQEASHVMLLSTRIGMINRCLDASRSLMQKLRSFKGSESDKLLLSQDSRKLASLLSCQRHYLDDSYDPRFVIFEYSFDICLRKMQVRNIREFTSHKRNIVKQAIMGGGKTSVLSPILTFMLADGNHLLLQVAPTSLVDQSITMMRNIFSRTIKKRVKTLNFDRSDAFDLISIRKLYQKLEYARVNRDVVMASPEVIKSIFLKQLELVHNVAASKSVKLPPPTHLFINHEVSNNYSWVKLPPRELKSQKFRLHLELGSDFDKTWTISLKSSSAEDVITLNPKKLSLSIGKKKPIVKSVRKSKSKIIGYWINVSKGKREYKIQAGLLGNEKPILSENLSSVKKSKIGIKSSGGTVSLNCFCLQTTRSLTKGQSSEEGNKKIKEFEAKIEEIGKILKLFKNSILVMDEVDMLLHPLRSELNYPIGLKTRLDMSPERWDLPMHLMDAILCSQTGVCSMQTFNNSASALNHLERLKNAVSQGYAIYALQQSPHLVLLDQEFYHDKMKPHLLNLALIWLSNNHALDGLSLDIARQYLERNHSDEDAKRIPPQQIKMLNMTNDWLHVFCPHCLGKINRVGYGLLTESDIQGLNEKAPISRTLTAVPFVGKDVPSKSSEFAHPDVLIGLTILSYRYESLRTNDIVHVVNELKTRFSQELGPPPDKRPSSLLLQSWKEEAQKFAKTMIQKNRADEYVWRKQIDGAREVLPLAVVQLNDQKHISNIVQAFEKTPSVIHYYLQNRVFPECMNHYDLKLSASGQEIGGDAMFGRRLGFSGTPNSLLPIELGDCEFEKGTDGQILSVLTDPAVVSYELKTNWTVKSLLQDIAAQKTTKYEALIDTGALITGFTNLQVAEYLLQHGLKDKEGVVYLDEKDHQMILLRGGPGKDPYSIPLSQCGLSWEKRFTFYDQTHTTGIDIKQASNACAVQTLGKDMVLRDYSQGAYRMRGIGNGQKIHLFIISEVNRLIDTHVSKRTSMINDVAAWLVINSIKSEHLQFVQLIQQNLHNVWRKICYDSVLKDGPKGSIEVFREPIDYRIPDSVPKLVPFSEQFENLISAHKNILSSHPEAEKDLEFIREMTKSLSSGAKPELHLETEQERESEVQVEQEKEAEEDQEKEIVYNRDDEDPIPWDINELADEKAKQFYPFSQINLYNGGKNYISVPNFPSFILASNNFHRKQYPYPAFRRLNNISVILEWVPKKPVSKSIEFSVDDKYAKNAFDLFDFDGKQRLSHSEVQNMLKSIGIDRTDNEIEEIIQSVDEDNSGFIEINEFANILRKSHGDDIYEDGRHFVVLSLSEFESIRYLLHKNHPIFQRVDIAIRVIGMEESFVISRTKNFNSKSVPERQLQTVVQSYRFLNNDMFFDQPSIALLVQLMELSSCKVRQTFFESMLMCRRRNMKNWTKTSVSKIFVMKSQFHWLAFEGYRARLRYEIFQKGMLLIDAFRRFDEDEDGYLSTDELYAGIQSLNINLDKKHVKELIDAADLDSNGLIDTNEFTNFLYETPIPKVNHELATYDRFYELM